VAFDGTNYLVVWNQAAGGDSDIFGARIKGDGTFLSGPFQISASTKNDFYPDVAWSGNGFLVVWQLQFDTSGGDWDIHGRVVSAAGGLVSADNTIEGAGPSNQQLPAVGANADGFFVAWQDERNAATSSTDIYGRFVTFDGVPSGAVPVSTDGRHEERPDVAWNGSTFLVVWQLLFAVSPSTDWDVLGQRVTSGPNDAIFGNRITISNGGRIEQDAQAASDGTNVLVVWDDLRSTDFDIFGARVDRNGTVLDTSGIPITTKTRTQIEPEVAFNGSFLVAWEDEYRSAGVYDIEGARVRTDGTVVDNPSFRIATAGPQQLSNLPLSKGAGSAWGGVHEFHSGSNADILLRRISPK
jgi:hypothetical protein